jgi:hypothetical protein
MVLDLMLSLCELLGSGRAGEGIGGVTNNFTGVMKSLDGGSLGA